MKTCLFLLLWVIFAAAFYPEPSETILAGKVTGDDGPALSGAVVHVSRDKDFAKDVLTDKDGNFRLTLDPGIYDVEVRYTGYSIYRVQQVAVLANQVNTLNMTLASGNLVLNEVVVTKSDVNTKEDLSRSKRAPAPAAKMAKKEKSGQTASAVSSASRPAPSGAHASRKVKDYHDIPPGKPLYTQTDTINPPSEYNTETYARILENPFLEAKANAVSTFSIDVDAAAYSNTRRFLQEGRMPPADAVRIEEFVNYFDYQYPAPTGAEPFSVNTELAECPWNPKHRLLLIGLQGRQIETGQLPPGNFVFLVDVSGSMNQPNKLPLVQQSLAILTDNLRPQDRVALVVYAGAAGLVLPSTPGSEKATIKAAIERLSAGGSTAGAAGIRQAYAVAQANFIRGGNNRVVLCTDGDFNVGVSSEVELVKLIEKERESGVFLTVLGFGTGNYQDSKMQQLADKGNGNHGYIDQIGEAKKMLISEFGGTLFAIAKDVKIQIEFNPAKVAGYRLIGYENRMLAREDFDDDTKDAGELGAGHRVTALYEVVPAGQPLPLGVKNGEMRYQQSQLTAAAGTGELLTLKLRYKQPKTGAASSLVETRVDDKVTKNPSQNFQLAAAAAGFGLLLRNSVYKGEATFERVLALAQTTTTTDPGGYRRELCDLIEKAKLLSAPETARK